MQTTTELSAAIREKLEGVMAVADAASVDWDFAGEGATHIPRAVGGIVCDAPQAHNMSESEWRANKAIIAKARTVTPQLARALLGELTAHEERLAELPPTRNLSDPDLMGYEVFYKVWHTNRIRGIARELGILEDDKPKSSAVDWVGKGIGPDGWESMIAAAHG